MKQKLELVEGTPQKLPDGTTVDVRGVMYAHMADSKNLSSAMLVVTHDGKTVEVPVSRLHGGNPDKAPPGKAFGWELTLEMADPYQQPSRAIVWAEHP